MKNRFTVNQNTKRRRLPAAALLLIASLVIAGGLYAGMRLSADNISTDTLLREKESIERAMERYKALAAGAVVALVPTLLRIDPAIGLVGPAWMFAVVWSTDILAYVTGRLVGSITGTLLNVIPFRQYALPVFIIYMAVGILVGAFGGVNAIRNYLKV